ncbi:MAG: toxin-antitoxin system protein [Clostridia bacterium]|nr:toxin-antitoxin system protein [Clostridia bacterium]
MRPLKEKISITIDGDVLETLRKKAEQDDRSLSQYINLVLKEHIREADKKASQ